MCYVRDRVGGALAVLCLCHTLYPRDTLQHLRRPGVPTLAFVTLEKLYPFSGFELLSFSFHSGACKGSCLLIHSYASLKCHWYAKLVNRNGILKCDAGRITNKLAPVNLLVPFDAVTSAYLWEKALGSISIAKENNVPSRSPWQRKTVRYLNRTFSSSILGCSS